MKIEKPTISIIIQVAAFFLIGVLVTGILTYISESSISEDSVKEQMEVYADEIANEVRLAITEFPAGVWLEQYWYTHSDELDIEYDAEFRDNIKTAEKCRIFSERNPDLQLRYLDYSQCEALSEEDQKLYAEITYSWLLTRINQIKRVYNVDYLFCVVSQEPYEQQVFLFSGAYPGAVRGTAADEAYPLGHTVRVSESQTVAMREAIQNSSHLADAGDYMDYYTVMSEFEDYCVLIGITYDLSELIDNIESRAWAGTGLALFTQIILSLICLALIYYFVLRPLKIVQSSIRSYKETKNSETIIEGLEEAWTHNEIGQLTEDVSEMVREIDAHMEKIQTITAEKQRISTELDLATRIQAAMLPNDYPAFPDRTEFDVYASMDPAREVGGDFYDYFLIDDDHLCIVIADVSGKGVPAALFMMASKIILANNAKMGKSPAAVLHDTNVSICSHNQEEMFVTVWMGILEISTGKFVAANAGHEYPVLMQDGKIDLMKDRHGMIIGGMEDAKYTEYEFTMKPGDKLFVYTDGVPEATDADKQMFGLDRMLSALNTDPNVSTEQILKNVRTAVDGFVKDAEQFDDLTMLCLEYRGV